MKKTPPLEPDDSHLWDHVKKSVKPYQPKKKPVAAVGARRSPAEKQSPPPRPAASAPPVATGGRDTSGFDTSTATKMKKGQLPIEGKIDLHGLTQEEAHRKLMGFISRAAAAEKRMLLVITGKGSVATGGVLRRMLPLWLEHHPQILAVTPAAPKDGGTGAWYIRLRKPR